MSENPRVVTEAHFRYIGAHTAADDDFLRALKREAIEAGLPAISIAPELVATEVIRFVST